MSRRPALTAGTARAAALLLAASASQAAAPEGELRLRWDERVASADGPLAQAHRLRPAIGTGAAQTASAELGLRGGLAAAGLTLQADALLLSAHDAGAGQRSDARVNELHLGTERGPWAVSAGKKVLGWDVGHGFRPNDVVQQEARRTLLATALEGRPLLQAEHFGADSAATLVWVNPQAAHRPLAASPGGEESAVAARLYQRDGDTDWHGFARAGRHTGASLGMAVAQVPGEALEWHASWRWLQRHSGWALDAGQTAAPWQQRLQGPSTQWLLGAQWTGSAQQSLLVEWWHDGSTLSAAQWRDWTARNRSLPQAALPQPAVAGLLAGQTAPLAASSLQRENLFIRLAWQPGRWTLSADALLHPADHGAALTLAAQWQGERWRLNAALRQYGGPADAVLRQLPQRRLGVLAATWAF